MVLARIAAIALAVLVLGSGSVDAAGPLRSFKLGFWSGGAYTDERTGDFTHCSAGVAYDSGINMFILVTAGYRWWLGFIDPHWAFSPRTRLEVELRLDGGAPFPRFATVPSGQLLLVPLPDNSGVIDRLRQSSQLSLIAQGEAFRFELSETAAVLDELRGCVRSSAALAARASSAPSPTAASASSETKQPPAHTATPSETAARGGGPPAAASPAPSPPAPPDTAAAADMHAAPGTPEAALSVTVAPQTAPALPAAPVTSAFAAASPQTPGPSADAAGLPFAPLPEALRPTQPTALEEIRLARDFFTTAQLPNARLVVTDKPAALASFTAVWRSDNAAGAVKIIAPGPDVSGSGIASNLIAVDPQMCKGDFATARSSASFDSSVVFSAVLSCTEANEQRTAQYFITPRRQGGFVVFAVVGSSPVGGVAGADRPSIDLFTRAAVRAAESGG